VSESEESPVALDETVASIARFANPVEVIALPRAEEAHDDAIVNIAGVIDR
jgi:hypothetical protein